jgi:hypothetical protein
LSDGYLADVIGALPYAEREDDAEEPVRGLVS